MSFASSTSTRFRLKRSAMLVSAGIVAAALAVAGPIAANAVTPPTVTSNTSTASAYGQVVLTVDGFQPNEALTVTFDSSSLTTYADTGYTQGFADATGHYVAAAYLPGTATVGAHTITVTGATTPAATTPITVVAQPTAAANPSSVALSSYLSKGVTATFTGFAPGSTVSFGISNPGMGDPAGPDAVVGASGVVSITYVPTAGSPFANQGTYQLSAFTKSGNVLAQAATFVVTPNAVVAPTAPVAAPAAPVKNTASFTG